MTYAGDILSELGIFVLKEYAHLTFRVVVYPCCALLFIGWKIIYRILGY
jgi:hypothetical protein